MVREVYCYKLNKTAEGLEEAPYPGEIGEKIYNHISKLAWDTWLSHQIMLINEYRLSLFDLKAREFLEEEMLKFLFGEGSKTPPGYIGPEK